MCVGGCVQFSCGRPHPRTRPRHPLPGPHPSPWDPCCESKLVALHSRASRAVKKGKGSVTGFIKRVGLENRSNPNGGRSETRATNATLLHRLSSMHIYSCAYPMHTSTHRRPAYRRSEGVDAQVQSRWSVGPGVRGYTAKGVWGILEPPSPVLHRDCI